MTSRDLHLMSWMTAITDRVNSFWRSLHGGPSIPLAAVNVPGGDGIVRVTTPQEEELSCRDDRGLPCLRQGAPVDPVETEYRGPREMRSPSRQISD